MILVAAVAAIGPFTYGGWAMTFGWFILVAVALAYAMAGRRVFRDCAQVGGLLLVVVGVPFIGAFGLGLYPFVSGLAILAASRIGADGPTSTRAGPSSAPTANIS